MDLFSLIPRQRVRRVICLVPGKLIAWITASLLALTILLGCGETNSSQQAEPDRPESVPGEALWTGGADGGVFVLVQPKTGGQAHEYEGAVYAEGTGVVWYRGDFVMEPEDAPAFEYRDAASYGAWDGDTLYLRDGRKLVTAPTSDPEPAPESGSR